MTRTISSSSATRWPSPAAVLASWAAFFAFAASLLNVLHPRMHHHPFFVVVLYDFIDVHLIYSYIDWGAVSLWPSWRLSGLSVPPLSLSWNHCGSVPTILNIRVHLQRSPTVRCGSIWK